MRSFRSPFAGCSADRWICRTAMSPLPKGDGSALHEAVVGDQPSDALEASVDPGVVLVTGCVEPLGPLILEALAPLGAAIVRAEPSQRLLDVAEVDDFLTAAAARHPGKVVRGLIHFGASGRRLTGVGSEAEGAAAAGPADAAAAAVLDAHLRSLVTLVSRLVPAMRSSELPCRILTISSESALLSPTAWGGGQGMRALAGGFVEQYTEALAEDVRGSGVTVYGARLAESLGEGDAQASLAGQLRAVWALPAREAHGRIIAVPSKENTLRGGNVLGPSVDARWALRAAAGRAADYPADARPLAYAQLAEELGVPEKSLVWCHGASDVIVRAAAAAVARRRSSGDEAGSPGACTALQQAPTWPNAEALLRSGGFGAVAPLPYPNPWRLPGDDAAANGRGASSAFWAALEREVTGDSPPALVYLVHPHFPTGFKDAEFGRKLQAIIARSNGGVLFLIDQTYLGFTPRTEDDDLLEALAVESDAVVIVRSLSKVEGLAALRLGYALASPATAREIVASLPFLGGLYISELALASALAALSGGSARRHRADVLEYYRAEQDWLTGELADLGFTVDPSPCPFFTLRGPTPVILAAVKAGAALQKFVYPNADGNARQADDGSSHVCCLVAERAANAETVGLLAKAIEEQKAKEASALPGPEALMKLFTGGFTV